MSTQQDINQIFLDNNITLTEQQLEDFTKYYDLLVEWNQKFNLTAITDLREVAEKHFIDSIVCLDKLSNNQKIVDIGAGAGFPSIPLSIMNRDLNFILIDSVNKKVTFLQEVIKQLDMHNMVAMHSRIEDIATSVAYREKFDICLSRAVARLNTLVEYALPLVKVGGQVIAYKSKLVDEEVQEAQKAIKLLGGKVSSVDKFDVVGQKRALVNISKVSTTPNKYPRKSNKARTQPIV